MEQINGVYEWDAQSYHQFSDMQYDVALALLRSVPLTGDETILDAGCGSGRVTIKILERLPHGKVIGVDLSQNMLAKARDVVRAKDGQSVEFAQADLQHFSMPRAVDGIFSSMCMHFVPDHALMFRNLAQTLRPGGWLAVQFASTLMQQGGIMRNFQQIMSDPRYAQYLGNAFPPMHEGSAEASRQELAQAGFVDIDVQTVQDVLSDAHRKSMFEFMRTAFIKDAVDKLPDPQLKEEFTTCFFAAAHEAFAGTLDYIRCQARLPHLM